MVLSKYKPDILRFVYNLTRTEEVLSPLRLSKFLNSIGQDVSDRTIKRWFNFLGADIGYFSMINYSEIGLMSVAVLIKNPNEIIVEIIPYLYHVFSGYDGTNLDDYLIIQMLVPKGHIKEVEQFWNVSKDLKLIDEYDLFPFNNVVDIYSPFQDIIDETGQFIFEKQFDNSKFINLLNYKSRKSSVLKMNSLVRKNPLLIPVLIEYSRERWSSHQVWEVVKSKLEVRVWKYVRKLRTRFKRTDFAGIALVQKILREVNNNYDNFFHQVRVLYWPLYDEKASIFQMFLKFKSKKDMLNFAEEMSKRAVVTIFYLPFDVNSKIVRVWVSTNSQQQSYIVRNILPKYIDLNYDNKIIYRDIANTHKYWSPDTYQKYVKLNYAKFFDPTICEWKFDLDEYLEDLNNLTN